ncbi:MAG: MarR family winged helix-turn-helix transcriptional regulator [Thermoplasmata archaeon]|nr:MarR family winged helix-turn-helix transcriptional regulator [Thermoplasmata archaeon]
MAPRERLWADFSFVVSSGYRERVLSALAEKPKLPTQLAHETRVRIFHVSRALRELASRRLVVCLTPELRGRGRLYGLTEEGSHLLKQILGPSRYPVASTAPSGAPPDFVPKVRASTVLRFVRFLQTSYGRPRVEGIIQEWGVDVTELTEDSWLPVEAAARLLELVERGFGDGSYSFIRSAFSRAVASFPTIQEQLSRLIPISALARRAPGVYGREWNYGRLAVDAHGRKAVMRHYDWMPTPAMCAMFHGVYEGIMSARGVAGTVVKTSCVRTGAECCEYLVSW